MSGRIQRHARVLSVLLAARSAYAAPAPEAGQGRLIQQDRSGFFVLWTEFRRSERGSPKVFVAQNRAQLAELWREFDVDVQPPKMNFGKWLVVAQQIPVACSLDRPHELLLSARAQLEVLSEPRSGLVGCTDVARESIAVIAVARDALPQQFEFIAAGKRLAVRQQIPDTAGPLMPWVTEDPTPPPTIIRGQAPRPAVGEDALLRLADGTPVWVVAHADQSYSALLATRPVVHGFPCAPKGVRSLLRFDRSSRTFDGEWDEYGNHRNTLSADLERFAVAVDPAHPQQLLLGERVAATRRTIAVPVSGPLTYTPTLLPAGPSVSLTAALQAQPGSVVMVDAQLVTTSQGAYLCEPALTNDGTHCRADSPPVLDVTPLPTANVVFTLGPPVLVRRVAQGFVEATYLDRYSCGFGAASQTGKVGAQSPPRRRNHSVGELGGYAVVATDRGGHLYAGGELRLGFRYSFEAIHARTTMDDVLEGMVGNSAGASIRLRFVVGSPAGTPQTAALVSLAPRVDIAQWPYTVPSLITPLVPEIGVSLNSDSGADYFLGFSAPLRFGYSHEVIPSFTWFGSGQTWLMLSLGGSL